MDDKAEYENLPPAVKRQVAEVEARQQEAAAKTNQQQPQQQEDSDGGQTEGRARQQAEALLDDDADLDESEKGRQSIVDWQAEFQKEAARNAELQRQLMMLQSMQASQQQAPQAQPEQRQDAGPDWASLAEQYPEDLVNLMRSMYDRMQTMQAGQAQVQQQAASVGQQQFVQQLTAAVPDWQTKNRDQGWIKWLAEADPLSGIVRQRILDDAASRMDAGRVANIFNSYFGGKAQAPAKPKKSAGLADLAEPASARTTVAGEPPKSMSLDDVRKLNAEISRNPKMRADPAVMKIISGLGGEIPVVMQ